MAKVSSKDNVLLIGGGILPSESIIISEATNANVITIDNNSRACKLAQNFIKKIRISDKITVIHADGINFSVQDFDVVFIAINVWPIDSVFRNLSKNLKSNARVVCKSFKEDMLYILKKEGLLIYFSLEKILENPKTRTYLFIKK